MCLQTNDISKSTGGRLSYRGGRIASTCSQPAPASDDSPQKLSHDPTCARPAGVPYHPPGSRAAISNFKIMYGIVLDVVRQQVILNLRIIWTLTKPIQAPDCRLCFGVGRWRLSDLVVFS